MALFDEIYKGMKETEAEFINENSIYKDQKHNMLIFCRPSDKKVYGRTAYFKVYNSCEQRKATKVARICFYEPKYVIHHNDPDNCSTWFLNSTEIKNLISILKIQNNVGIRYQSTWEALINTFNSIVKSNHPEDIIPVNIPIPDYNLLSRKECIK